MWILVSFTEISAPLAPYKPGHMVGIVENDGGDREIVQVERASRLYIGMSGEVRHVEDSNGTSNYFVPENGDKS